MSWRGSPPAAGARLDELDLGAGAGGREDHPARDGGADRVQIMGGTSRKAPFPAAVAAGGGGDRRGATTYPAGFGLMPS